MANTIQSLYNDTAKEAEKTEEQAKAALQAQVEMARIEAEKEIAKAQNSNASVIQQTSSQSKDSNFNWMDALELATDIIF